jgi:hypothetical protein
MGYDEVVLDPDDVGISGVAFLVGERPDSDGYSNVGLLLFDRFALFHLGRF